jgi:saccharopine dehydrogenase-like NADP-dependent oxidoreductase
MKQILLFGAGKSATALIHYLIQQAPDHSWHITICDTDLALARSKTGNSSYTSVSGVNVTEDANRALLISNSDVVISLLPPPLHFLVAKDCINQRKPLLTASYIDDKIRAMEKDISENNLLFLCEMGLDPGIDHMSAMKIVHRIQDKGGIITGLKSHCGGLVAPESDNNPWRYKISWNPRNIVLAGKAGADFKEENQVRHYNYKQLFDSTRTIEIPGLGALAWYPNRDSLNYINIYGVQSAQTFVRTTLRYPEFCAGWKNIIDLELTNENTFYDTDGMTLQAFFQIHFKRHGCSEWIENQLTSRFTKSKLLLEKLQQLLEAEEQATASEAGKEVLDFMLVDDSGELKDINLDEVKNTTAATVAGTMYEANLAIKQLFFLGMTDDQTYINKGNCSAADILQFALERKLALGANDRDMIVMVHEIQYEFDGRSHQTNSWLIQKGEDHLNTAMAKTVGLPLGIAAKLILEGKINLSGLHIPTLPEIYIPVLYELEKHGIAFVENTI